jgi:site-specific DNA-methyltransferase (adenine-specific)
MMLEKVTIGDATLYLGDALVVLPQLDIQADALITDPPYCSGGTSSASRVASTTSKYVQSVTATKASHNRPFSGDQRDPRSFRFWVTMWLLLAREHLREGAYALAFSDWRQAPMMTDAMQASGLIWRGTVPWDKTESIRAPHTGYFRHQCEYVIWGSNGPLQKSTHGGPWPGCIRARVNPREKLHMTGKPIALMSALVRCVTPGGLILDPFMGSASTGVAALLSGRKFVGIECDRHSFDVSCDRLQKLQHALSAA